MFLMSGAEQLPGISRGKDYFHRFVFFGVVGQSLNEIGEGNAIDRASNSPWHRQESAEKRFAPEKAPR